MTLGYQAFHENGRGLVGLLEADLDVAAFFQVHGVNEVH